MRRGTLIGLLSSVLLASVAAAPGASAGVGFPALLYFTDASIEVVAIDGQPVASFRPYQWVSLDGNVFAGSRQLSGDRFGEFVRVANATTGQELFRISNAFAPIVLAGGNRIGFMPDRFARRDPYFATVWIRNAHGRERAVVRFAGPRSTVTPTPFHGDGAPLDQAWDADGRTLAVTYGNDVDLFVYDVWVVDVETRAATRVSTGKVSRHPTLSPSGERLALVREVDTCGGPDPGYRAAQIRTMTSSGADERVLLYGTCALFYTDPRWISEDELVAARLTRVSPGVYDTDLVRVDAASGSVTEITSDGDAGFFNVSPSLQQLVFERRSVFPGFVLYDLTAETSTAFADGFLPQLAGVHRLT